MFVTQEGWQQREGRDRRILTPSSGPNLGPAAVHPDVRTLSLGPAAAPHDPHPPSHGWDPTPTLSSVSRDATPATQGPGQILSTTLGSLVAHALASTLGRTPTVLSLKADVRLMTTPDLPAGTPSLPSPPTTCRSYQIASPTYLTRHPASPTRLSRPLVRAPHRHTLFPPLVLVREPRERS
jgi:hypothetical protein